MTTAHQIFPRQGSPARKRSSGPRPWELPEPSARRRLREQWGLTTQQVAAAFGVTPATVRSWERGRSTPRGERREAYRRFLAGLAQQGTTGSALPRAAVGGAASPAAARPAPSASGAAGATPAAPAAPSAATAPAAPAAPAAVTPSAAAVIAPSAAAPASGPVGPAGPGPAARSAPSGPGRSAAPRRSADPLSPERLLRLRLLGAAACLVSLLWWLVLTCPPAP